MRSDRFHPRLVLALALAAVTPAALSQEVEPGIVVLTGSLIAAEAERFAVPVTSNWQLTLQWIIAEGERVEAGESIALLDPGGVEDQLLETEENLIAKSQERSSKEAEGRLQRMDLELALKRAEVEYRKARVDAAVPQDVLDGVDYRQRQLEMAKKRRDFEQAELELLQNEASLRAELADIDIEIEELYLDRDRYSKELESLDLRATRAGIVVHEEHPWEGRKVLQGDRLQATLPVARIPDLDTLEVEAWAGETDAVRLAPGQRVTMHLDAYPDQRLEGMVLSVGAAGELRTSWGRAPYFRVRISLDRRDPSIMKPGMSVRCVVGAPPRIAQRVDP